MSELADAGGTSVSALCCFPLPSGALSIVRLSIVHRSCVAQGNPTKKRKLNKTPLAADTDGMATTTAASSSAKRRAVASDDDETGTITIITPDSPKRPQKGVAKAESASQSSRPAFRFHTSADPEFSPIALPAFKGQEAADWREWQSPKCRCLQCEALRVAALLKG